MNDALVAWPDFNRFQPASSLDGRPKDEIPIHVGATRGKSERFFGFDDFIRTAELPAGDKLWGGG